MERRGALLLLLVAATTGISTFDGIGDPPDRNRTYHEASLYKRQAAGTIDCMSIEDMTPFNDIITHCAAQADIRVFGTVDFADATDEDVEKLFEKVKNFKATTIKVVNAKLTKFKIPATKLACRTATFSENPKLTEIQFGLEVQATGAPFTIGSNPALTKLDFSQVSTLEGAGWTIAENPEIKSLIFPNLQIAQTDQRGVLNVSKNIKLESIEFTNGKLKNFLFPLHITGNPALTKLETSRWVKIGDKRGDVVIKDNDALKAVDFKALKTVDANAFSIFENKNLQSVGLGELESLPAGVDIHLHQTKLKSFVAPKLKVLTLQKLTITENSELVEVNLGGAEKIVLNPGSFTVVNNPKLKTLKLASLQTLEAESLTVAQNPLLEALVWNKLSTANLSGNCTISQNQKLETLKLSSIKSLEAASFVLDSGPSSLVFPENPDPNNPANLALTGDFVIRNNVKLTNLTMNFGMVTAANVYVQNNPELVNWLAVPLGTMDSTENLHITGNPKLTTVNLEEVFAAPKLKSFQVIDNPVLRRMQLQFGYTGTLQEFIIRNNNMLVEAGSIVSQAAGKTLIGAGPTAVYLVEKNPNLKTFWISDVKEISNFKDFVIEIPLGSTLESAKSLEKINVVGNFSVQLGTATSCESYHSLTSLTAGRFFVSNNPALTECSMGMLTEVSVGNFTIENNPQLTTLDLGSFGQGKGALFIYKNQHLESINVTFKNSQVIRTKFVNRLSKDDAEYLKKFAQNDAHVQKTGECQFDNKVSDLSDLDPCTNVKTLLEFGPKISGKVLPKKDVIYLDGSMRIENSDLTLANLTGIKLFCGTTTKITITNSNTVCWKKGESWADVLVNCNGKIYDNLKPEQRACPTTTTNGTGTANSSNSESANATHNLDESTVSTHTTTWHKRTTLNAKVLAAQKKREDEEKAKKESVKVWTTVGGGVLLLCFVYAMAFLVYWLLKRKREKKKEQKRLKDLAELEKVHKEMARRTEIRNQKDAARLKKRKEIEAQVAKDKIYTHDIVEKMGQKLSQSEVERDNKERAAKAAIIEKRKAANPELYFGTREMLWKEFEAKKEEAFVKFRKHLYDYREKLYMEKRRTIIDQFDDNVWGPDERVRAVKWCQFHIFSKTPVGMELERLEEIKKRKFDEHWELERKREKHRQDMIYDPKVYEKEKAEMDALEDVEKAKLLGDQPQVVEAVPKKTSKKTKLLAIFLFFCFCFRNWHKKKTYVKPPFFLTGFETNEDLLDNCKKEDLTPEFYAYKDYMKNVRLSNYNGRATDPYHIDEEILPREKWAKIHEKEERDAEENEEILEEREKAFLAKEEEKLKQEQLDKEDDEKSSVKLRKKQSLVSEQEKPEGEKKPPQPPQQPPQQPTAAPLQSGAKGSSVKLRKKRSGGGQAK